MANNAMQSVFSANWKACIFLIVIYVSIVSTYGQAIERKACENRDEIMVQTVNEFRKRLFKIREQMMIRTSTEGPEINAYILTTYDEHLNVEVAYRDKRLSYLTGFNGTKAIAVITNKNAAIWTEKRFIQQADFVLDCDWEIYYLDGDITISDWLKRHLHVYMRVGADPHIIPHKLWQKLNMELNEKFLKLVRVNINLVDLIWTDRPEPDANSLKVHPLKFAGEKWESKVIALRNKLAAKNYDAMVITSLSEVAYLLNIRGNDLPFSPFIKGYVVVTPNDIILYLSSKKLYYGALLHLKAETCHNNLCVTIREYEEIWHNLRTNAQIWKRVLIPTECVFDKGASQAIYSALPEDIVFEDISPIIFMKAQKNFIERAGMRTAHIRDSAAICEAMNNIEQRFTSEKWTELRIKYEIELSRLSQPNSKGLSLPTVVAFGENSALPYYANSIATDIEINDQSTLLIESGGQYLDGTTDIARTYHFGEPTPEQKRAYTNVLSGILLLSNLRFPSDLQPSKIDTLLRVSVWKSLKEYPQATGHGIGSHSSVQEAPIEVSYTNKNEFPFEEGYFFSSELGFYESNQFGIKLKNVLEVTDIERSLTTGKKFLAFEEVSLVPYEPKLIDATLLTEEEKRTLNQYNAKIREYVGDELKRQGNMRAFYWMMNKTRHIRENEYKPRSSSSSTTFIAIKTLLFVLVATCIEL